MRQSYLYYAALPFVGCVVQVLYRDNYSNELTAQIHCSTFKWLVKDAEYLMAIHNACIIVFILYFSDHFPRRRSDDLKTDFLHSTFSTGKQLSLCIISYFCTPITLLQYFVIYT